MKVIRIFIIVTVLGWFYSCNTQITKDYQCNIDFGIDRINLDNVVVDFIKKDFHRHFEFYIYRVEECPGPISTNCTRSYTFYDQRASLLLKKDLITSNECFVLGEKQKYIFPVFNSNSYKVFTSSITDETIKDELIKRIKFETYSDSLRKEIMRIDKKRKRELLKVKIENVDVYEFEMNTEQLNYYIRPNGIVGAIYTYSAFPAQKTKILILVPTEN